MFWKKKPKLPITPEDQVWVEESLSFLRESLGEETLLSVTTVEPTAAFFDREFDGSETDAEFILKRCMASMQIPQGKVQLEFYSEDTQTLDDGTIVTTSADIFGKSSGAAGTYQKQAGKTLIRIERGQLKHPESLIATISHELAHEKLLGEHRIIENNEYLTDLTAIVYGFGIFIANAKFQFASGLNSGFGWQMQSQGYLPEQVSAYAMASLSLKKKEGEQPYTKHLDASVRKYFERSLAYLQSNNNKKDATVFWKKTINTSVQETLERIVEKKTIKDTDLSANTLKELRKDLVQACYQVDLDTVETLLERGVSPNFVDIGGTPLSIAVLRGSVDLIELLLRYNADIDYSEPGELMDCLPLMEACKKENIALITYLLKLGATLDRVAGNGKSILEVAVETGNIEVVDFLIKAGANTEIKSGLYLKFDKTPICAAVMNNDTQMVTFLVKNGAKTKPIRKMTRHEIHPKMVKFLKARRYL